MMEVGRWKMEVGSWEISCEFMKETKFKCKNQLQKKFQYFKFKIPIPENNIT
jgi:hypothetical protein